LSTPGGNTSASIDVVPNSPPVVELKNSDPGFLFQSDGL